MRILPLQAYFLTATGLLKNVLLRKQVYPFYASFKVTARCHFGCPFCNMKKDHSPDLSTDDVKKVMDNLSKSSVLMASFEGGEPLLRDDIEELLEYAQKNCNFYLLFTTSVKNILEYPMEKYAKNIDFLHISMDEGHDNLELYNLLPELTKLPTQISVQVVVTRDTVKSLEKKVKACYDNGANIVIIPAAPMEDAEHLFPDIDKLEILINELRKKYPQTIHTPKNYFNSYRKAKCSSSSIIIAPDAKLYYPCHMLEEKTIDLRESDLAKWMSSKEAKVQRKKMSSCKINCGWYQYYSTDAYLNPLTTLESLAPMLFQIFRNQ